MYVCPDVCCAAELSAAFAALAPIRVLWHINTQVSADMQAAAAQPPPDLVGLAQHIHRRQQHLKGKQPQSSSTLKAAMLATQDGCKQCCTRLIILMDSCTCASPAGTSKDRGCG